MNVSELYNKINYLVTKLYGEKTVYIKVGEKTYPLESVSFLDDPKRQDKVCVSLVCGKVDGAVATTAPEDHKTTERNTDIRPIEPPATAKSAKTTTATATKAKRAKTTTAKE